jgi:hypothetical protein
MRRIVVCDTGPLLHLSEANIIHLLRLVGEVFIPAVVVKEFNQNSSGFKLPDWIMVKDLDEPQMKKALLWENQIDAGESAAIALAMQMHADWLLSDDAIARQFGESLGLEIHGSIGFLLWAIATGHVESENEALSLLKALAGSSLLISDRVLNEACKAIGELYAA